MFGHGDLNIIRKERTFGFSGFIKQSRRRLDMGQMNVEDVANRPDKIDDVSYRRRVLEYKVEGMQLGCV
jgi:hypothetical protein